MLNPHAIDVNIIENVEYVDNVSINAQFIPIHITMETSAKSRKNPGFQPFQHLYNYYG